jgi:membrane protease YdiL (CAAX protease family)
MAAEVAAPAEASLSATARTRDTVVGGVVTAAMIVWISLVATEGQGRWPWVGFVILAAAPFLLIPVPWVRERLRASFAGHPSRSSFALAGITAYGLVLSILSGASRWYNILLWPVCVAVSTLAAGTGDEAEIPVGRLLITAVPVWILAGVWDAQLQVRVPGTIDIGLPYFAALDVALFLLLVVRPLRTLDMGLGLARRDLLAALGAVVALMLIALPVGYAVGFLQFNVRWNGVEYASGRLIGLILFVGLPEEMLFRGIFQEAFSRLWGGRAGWIAGSVLFGLAHIVKHAPPLNWRYALLATIAGFAYGWVYRKTGRLGAAALTHGLVDWTWGTFLLVP